MSAARRTSSSIASDFARPGRTRRRRHRDAHRARRDPRQQLKGYAPYGNGSGDVKKAMAEMKLSKYDTNKDGLCDASVCKTIFHRARRQSPAGDGARHGSELQEDRDHAQDAHPQGSVHAAPDPAAEPRALVAARVRGARTTPTRRRSTVRSSTAAASSRGTNQLLAARHHARDRQEGRRQGQHHRRSERERGPRTSALRRWARRA